ncbi:hypothetical protein F3Y22_tig00109983pilonHSYRG00012 [Hibiscus syriacus]|uniref:Iron-sulfur cluster biosynthesis family protein n=1 Tax=Hibiscus syriacus TaxID=106335 RepID=A0A6A3BVC5_HIBSY|nr:hypothetical protein F3Y22_tig00109983pilonHSYRG00012 [Hibiscus syriacus]
MASISTCLTLSPHFRLLTSKPSVSLNSSGIRPLNSPSTYPRKSLNIWRSRVSVPVIKATLDVGSNAIRPGGAVETDKLPSDVRKRAMEAVDAFGGRVTVGDVSSKAGLNLNQAQKALQALASDTNGFLEVSDEGDVLYVFPKDYRAKLAGKSFRIKFEPWVDNSKAALEYIVRVSFGTALIASIVLVYTTIIALITSRSDEDNRGRRGRSYDTGFTFYLSPTDLFWYWDPYYRKRRLRTDNDEKMNFIESVFSFVFGDGDPNQGIEEERWKLIGQYIASNGGVVTAEELAPYLDLPTSNGALGDESYVLPVLLRFDGEPEIDEEGNILYRFQSLQRTASSQRSGRKEYVGRRWNDWVGGIENFLRRRSGNLVKQAHQREHWSLVWIYAGSFFAIPLLRWFFIRKRNTDIEKRNQMRKRFAQELESPDLSLRRKLLSARDMAQKTVIGPDRIVYSTDRDLVEQDYEAGEWDRRFREIEKSE